MVNVLDFDASTFSVERQGGVVFNNILKKRSRKMVLTRCVELDVEVFLAWGLKGELDNDDPSGVICLGYVSEKRIEGKKKKKKRVQVHVNPTRRRSLGCV